MTQPWNMARVRSRQLPRKYKPVGPVGTNAHGAVQLVVDGLRDRRNPEPGTGGRVVGRDHDFVCRACGYHVCSCERPQYLPPPYGKTDEGIEIRHYAYQKPGTDPHYFREANAIMCGLLTQEQLGVVRAFKVPEDCKERQPSGINSINSVTTQLPPGMLMHVDTVTYPMWKALDLGYPDVDSLTWNTRAPTKPEHITVDSVRELHADLYRNFGRVPNGVRMHPLDVSALKRSANVTFQPLDNPMTRNLELCTVGGVLRIIEDPSVPMGELRWKP